MEKTGTREWSDQSINIQLGCEQGCLYCWARYNAVERYKYCEARHWDIPCINNTRVDASHKKKYDGVVMYPTTHDITPANLPQYLCVLRKLLDAGNNILIVSKPHWECITVICNAYLQYREQIEFRFSIGSAKEAVLRFWEPNAPGFDERLACLQYARQMGYQTSLSCEPFLDKYVNRTYNACIEHVSKSFWVGPINNFKSRVKVPDPFESDSDRRIFYNTKAAQSGEVIKRIYEVMKDQPLIKFKNSFRKVVGI